MADRPVMKRGYLLGFATSRSRVPFTFDVATAPGVKNVVPITGRGLPRVGDNRAALNADGEKVTYSIGAIIDPSEIFKTNCLVKVI